MQWSYKEHNGDDYYLSTKGVTRTRATFLILMHKIRIQCISLITFLDVEGRSAIDTIGRACNNVVSEKGKKINIHLEKKNY